MDQTDPFPHVIDKYILAKLHTDVDGILSLCGLGKPASKRSGAVGPESHGIRPDPAKFDAYVDFEDEPSIYDATKRKPSVVVPAKPNSHP
jgi:hypothetical protein